MLQYMADQGIDPRRHMIEFMQYEPHIIGRGVNIDLDGQTNIPGLYAAGDPVGNFRADISGAATFGWIAGEASAVQAREIGDNLPAEKSPTVEKRREFYSAMITRQDGPSWKEANMAIQNLMRDYAGVEGRSETLLKAGRKYLADLRQKIETELTAADSHELMRCMEVLDLMECAKSSSTPLWKERKSGPSIAGPIIPSPIRS